MHSRREFASEFNVQIVKFLPNWVLSVWTSLSFAINTIPRLEIALLVNLNRIEFKTVSVCRSFHHWLAVFKGKTWDLVNVPTLHSIARLSTLSQVIAMLAIPGFLLITLVFAWPTLSVPLDNGVSMDNACKCLATALPSTLWDFASVALTILTASLMGNAYTFKPVFLVSITAVQRDSAST
jgi:hypothetical protein